MANFVLGYQHAFSQTSGDWSDSRENPMGVFASDKWKVTTTPHAGLRASLGASAGDEGNPGSHPAVPSGRASCRRSFVIIPSAPAGLFFIGDKYNGICVPDRGETGDFNNFGPRVGVAWDPTGTGKMSVRAGGGLFYYSRLPGLFLNDAAISPPFSLRIDLNDSTDRGLADRATLESSGRTIRASTRTASRCALRSQPLPRTLPS